MFERGLNDSHPAIAFLAIIGGFVAFAIAMKALTYLVYPLAFVLALAWPAWQLLEANIGFSGAFIVACWAPAILGVGLWLLAERLLSFFRKTKHQTTGGPAAGAPPVA